MQTATDPTADLYRHYWEVTRNETAAALLTIAETIRSLELIVTTSPQTPQSPPDTSTQKH